VKTYCFGRSYINRLKFTMMKNDNQIHENVVQQLHWEPFLNATHISVAVNNGIVTLSGTVDTYAQKVTAERAAKKVLGVKGIATDTQIAVSPVSGKTDLQISESVLNVLKWNSAVPEHRIKVTVRNGIVLLEGEVDWEYQRSSAIHEISNLTGVTNVINHITVKAADVAPDLKSQISAAIHRTATTSLDSIFVEVSDSSVILRGRVYSLAERDEAVEAAWCAPGITKVESQLIVEPELEVTF
jgi:osmotically-inducible protein OsmY